MCLCPGFHGFDQQVVDLASTLDGIQPQGLLPNRVQIENGRVCLRLHRTQTTPSYHRHVTRTYIWMRDWSRGKNIVLDDHRSAVADRSRRTLRHYVTSPFGHTAIAPYDAYGASATTHGFAR
jgi:hypothetical protein